MRLDITKRDIQVIIDALAFNIAKDDRKHAEQLRERLQFQMGQAPPPKATTSIRGHWPTSHVLPTKRENWAYKPLDNRVPRSNNGHKPLNAEQILASLSV